MTHVYVSTVCFVVHSQYAPDTLRCRVFLFLVCFLFLVLELQFMRIKIMKNVNELSP